jgi:hypothetical protein
VDDGGDERIARGARIDMPMYAGALFGRQPAIDQPGEKLIFQTIGHGLF